LYLHNNISKLNITQSSCFVCAEEWLKLLIINKVCYHYFVLTKLELGCYFDQAGAWVLLFTKLVLGCYFFVCWGKFPQTP